LNQQTFDNAAEGGDDTRLAGAGAGVGHLAATGLDGGGSLPPSSQANALVSLPHTVDGTWLSDTQVFDDEQVSMDDNKDRAEGCPRQGGNQVWMSEEEKKRVAFKKSEWPSPTRHNVTSKSLTCKTVFAKAEHLDFVRSPCFPKNTGEYCGLLADINSARAASLYKEMKTNIEKKKKLAEAQKTDPYKAILVVNSKGEVCCFAQMPSILP
jgi:hypothetical protein